MYNNPYYNNTPYYATPMMQYAQAQKPTMTQPLTQEQIALIASKGGNFSTAVSQEDLYRSWCTHKKEGNVALVSNGDGTCTCSVCGETFSTTDIDQDNVKKVTKDMIDVLQTIKTCYVDAPEEMVKQYFPIIELLKKAPQLAEIAMRNFSKYEQGSMLKNASNPYAVQTYNAITGGYGAYQQPLYGAAYQQPMYDPNMAMQGMPQQQPMYAPQPMAGQPMYQPAQPQQPMYAPAAPQQVSVTPGYGPNGFMPVNEFGAYGAPAGQVPTQQPMYAPTQQAPVQNPAPVQQAAPAAPAAPVAQAPQPTVTDVASFAL